MKQVKLKNFSRPVLGSIRTADRFYYVALGNGFKKAFPSEKLARAFLNETSRELSVKLFELNFLYSDLLRLYRSSWLYFDKNKITGLNNIEFLCNAKMEGINNSFNLLVERAAWENGNYTVFNHFRSIISDIRAICELLKRIFKKRGVTSSLYELDSYLLRCDYILTAITIYPQKIKLVAEQYHSEANYLKVV